MGDQPVSNVNTRFQQWNSRNVRLTQIRMEKIALALGYLSAQLLIVAAASSSTATAT